MVYNTETAEELGCDSFSNPNDFHHYSETLYRTKKGNYFMYGEGGPLSHYAENVGNNNTAGSERMWEVTEDEARNWLAKISPSKALELWPNSFPEA